MSELPKVYKNIINKNISNNNTVYYCTSKSEFREDENINIRDFLRDLESESGYLFNKGLIISTKDNEYDTAIADINNNYIYTISDDIISIDSIINIKRK